MSFEAVPYCRAVRSAKSLFDLALHRVAEVFDDEDINTGYLNHVIPQCLYWPIKNKQKLIECSLNGHDWSICSRVPTEIFLDLMNYDIYDGTPTFVHEMNYLKVEYVEMDRSIFPTVRYCLPCYNTYCRHRFAEPQTRMTLCREKHFIIGDELISYMQMERFWCNRCYDQPLFVVKDACNREVLRRYPHTSYRVYERALTRTE